MDLKTIKERAAKLDAKLSGAPPPLPPGVTLSKLGRRVRVGSEQDPARALAQVKQSGRKWTDEDYAMRGLKRADKAGHVQLGVTVPEHVRSLARAQAAAKGCTVSDLVAGYVLAAAQGGE